MMMIPNGGQVSTSNEDGPATKSNQVTSAEIEADVSKIVEEAKQSQNIAFKKLSQTTQATVIKLNLDQMNINKDHP